MSEGNLVRRSICGGNTLPISRKGEWRGEGLLMNARKLTLERQLFLDNIDSLPAERNVR